MYLEIKNELKHAVSLAGVSKAVGKGVAWLKKSGIGSKAYKWAKPYADKGMDWVSANAPKAVEGVSSRLNKLVGGAKAVYKKHVT